MKRFLILLLITLPCISSLASNGSVEPPSDLRPLYAITSPLESALDDRRSFIIDVGASTGCCIATMTGPSWVGMGNAICAGDYVVSEHHAYQEYIDHLWLEIHNTSEAHKTLVVYIDDVAMASKTIDYGWAYCYIPPMTLPSGNLRIEIIGYTGIVF